MHVGPPGLLLQRSPVESYCQVRLGDGSCPGGILFRRGCSRQIRHMYFENLKESIGKDEYGRGPRVSLQDTTAAEEKDPGSPAGQGAATATAAAAADGPLRHLHVDYY